MLSTENDAVFISWKSGLCNPHAHHSVDLFMTSQIPRSIKRGVGVFKLFPFSVLFEGGPVRNSSGTLTFFLSSNKKHPVCAWELNYNGKIPSNTQFLDCNSTSWKIESTTVKKKSSTWALTKTKTRKKISTPRLSPRCTCFPPRAISTQVPLVRVKVHLAYRLGVLGHWLGVLERSRPS